MRVVLRGIKDEDRASTRIRHIYIYETFELSPRYALINKGELSPAIIAVLMAVLTASGILAAALQSHPGNSLISPTQGGIPWAGYP